MNRIPTYGRDAMRLGESSSTLPADLKVIVGPAPGVRSCGRDGSRRFVETQSR